MDIRFQKIVLFAPKTRAHVVRCSKPVNDEKLAAAEESAEDTDEGKSGEIVITIDDEPCE